MVTKVNKQRLLEALTANKEKHRAAFEEAWEGYVIIVTKDLEERLERVKEGKSFTLRFNHPTPEDHTQDYQQAIDMLEWEIGNEVSLEYHEFAQYINDDWGWKSGWTVSNKIYQETATASKIGPL